MPSALGSARLLGEGREEVGWGGLGGGGWGWMEGGVEKGGSDGGVAVGLARRGGPLPAPSVAQPSHQLGSL